MSHLSMATSTRNNSGGKLSGADKFYFFKAVAVKATANLKIKRESNCGQRFRKNFYRK